MAFNLRKINDNQYAFASPKGETKIFTKDNLNYFVKIGKEIIVDGQPWIDETIQNTNKEHIMILTEKQIDCIAQWSKDQIDKLEAELKVEINNKDWELDYVKFLVDNLDVAIKLNILFANKLSSILYKKKYSN